MRLEVKSGKNVILENSLRDLNQTWYKYVKTSVSASIHDRLFISKLSWVKGHIKTHVNVIPLAMALELN